MRELFSVISTEELQVQQETVMKAFESLAQSLLRMAFSGKL
jgi:hypothetical protein